jgi:hypothetical protein
MRIRIEIKGKDEFWGRAFHVEWQHQFADRHITRDGEGHLLIEPEWMDDLEQVAAQTFCRVLRAPDNPRRRQWMSFMAGRARK